MNAAAEWGTLEPGKTADLLVINGRPDRSIGDTRKIDVVIKAGKIIDQKKLRFEANRDVGFQVFRRPPGKTDSPGSARVRHRLSAGKKAIS